MSNKAYDLPENPAGQSHARYAVTRIFILGVSLFCAFFSCNLKRFSLL